MSHSYLLYAEDDEDDTDIMKEMILSHSHLNPLVCVDNGFALLEHLQQIPRQESYPSLIILDVRLPKLDGIETLELLRTDDLYRLIPVVMFSSKLSKGEKERCQALGAEVLLKPLTYSGWLEVFDHFSAYIDE
ncbi:MAG TPA: response regulator [Chitinophagaceae bacterium]